MKKTIIPIIKWSGSKRFLAKEIISNFPKVINTYWERFCGGASVTRQLIESDIKINKIVCSDINKDLINLWIKIRDNPSNLLEEYKKRREIYLSGSEQFKIDYYKEVRKLYNSKRDVDDFFFLTKLSYCGVIRYNSKGEFNVPPFSKSDGIAPERLKRSINDWSKSIQKVEFLCQDYRDFIPSNDDFVFLDPPYFSNKSTLYQGKINYKELINFLSLLPCKWAMTIDGKDSLSDKSINLPTNIYKNKIYLNQQVSAWKKFEKKDVKIQDLLYLGEQ